MPYSSAEDILNAYAKVHTVGQVRDELDGFIRRADAIINGYLASRYPVPFAATPELTPPLINGLSVDLAMVDLLDRFPNTPEWVRERVKRAYDMLKLLKDGEMAVVTDGGALVEARTDIDTPRSNTSGYLPTFGAVTLPEDTQWDPSRVDDEAMDRM